jgi:hypothetical protein
VLEREEETEDTATSDEDAAVNKRDREKRNKGPMKTFHTKDTKLPITPRGTKGHVLAVMSMIEAPVKQTARSPEHTAMRWNRETLYMCIGIIGANFPIVRLCGNPFLLMRHADARPADAASDLHHISAVGPEQEIHREESSR